MTKKLTVKDDVENIIDLIKKFSTHENCIFRGENQNYGKVSSKLYRQYLEGENAIDNKNFSILTVEKDLIDKTKSHTSGNTNIEILTELQHYGGKTALIDFTHNVLIALFFACDGKFEKDGRIIVFDKSMATLQTDIDYANQDTYNIIPPTGKTPRVIFQSSIFIHIRQGYVGKKDCEFISIKKEQKKELLNYLQEYFHIETATIYNDLHGFIQNQDNYSNAEVEFYMGVACYDNKEFEKAIEYCNKAIKTKPQFVNAYYNRGVVKYDSGDKEGAIADYDKVIEINPEYDKAYHNRGIAKSVLGNEKEAIADYNQAIALNHKNAKAYYNRGISKSNSDDKEGAIADYDKAIEVNPKFSEAYNSRGNAKFALGNKKEAIADYDKAIEINSKYAEAYHNQGVAKSALGDKQGAIEDFIQVKILFEQQGKTELVAEAEKWLTKLKNDK